MDSLSGKCAEMKEEGDTKTRAAVRHVEEWWRRQVEMGKRREEELRVRLAEQQRIQGLDEGLVVAELLGKVTQLEEDVDTFVQLASARERHLNQHIARLERKLRRRDRYIELCDQEEEHLEERLAQLEGRVQGVQKYQHPLRV